MNNLILTNALTMSSNEIANLTNKKHKNVIRDIKLMLINLYGMDYVANIITNDNASKLNVFIQNNLEDIFSHIIDGSELSHELNQQVIIEKDYRGYISNIDLDMEHSLCLTSGYSVKQRMAIIKRWNELEHKQKNITTLPNFNNPAEAARAWADEVEKNQRLLVTNHEQTKKIESLESLFKHGESVTQFCKKLNGVNVMDVSKFLEKKNWLYNESKSGVRWRVKSYARDKYMTEEVTEITPHGLEPFIINKPVLLKAGAVKLYNMYLKNELPMKKTWNGEYTQDKELKGAA